MPIALPSRQTASKLSTTLVAGETVSALKVVRIGTNSEAFLSEPDVYENAQSVGVSLNTATAGNDVEVLSFGILEDPFFNFPVNDVLFLASGGAITNTAPTSGIRTIIGKSLGVGSIFISVQEPVIL